LLMSNLQPNTIQTALVEWHRMIASGDLSQLPALLHPDALFRFSRSQFGTECFRLISVESQFAKNARLFRRHASDGVGFLLAHASTISFGRNSSVPIHFGNAGRRISVIGSVTSTIAATTVSAVGTPTASPSTP